MELLVSAHLLAAALYAAASGFDGRDAPPVISFESVGVDVIESWTKALSSDKLGGRMAGSEGERLAIDFITKEFEKYGLRPCGDTGESGKRLYTQKFKLGTKMDGTNCVGMLEGTDSVLKNEIIVIGAHHDHIGNTGDQPLFFSRLGGAVGSDNVYNGADDNASGVAVLLAVARALHANKLSFKRTLVFITFSGEEWGLFGSRHYVDNPVGQIDKHIAMINLDMVGANKGQPVQVLDLATEKGDYFEQTVGESSKITGLSIRMEQGDIDEGDSDHSSFKKKGVPVIVFFSGLHDDYHRVTDHADLLDYERMAKTAQCIAYLLLRLANNEQRPSFDSEYEIKYGRRLRGRTLGISVAQDVADREYDSLGLKSEQGVVKVSGVHPASAAAKSGIKEGDLIISFDDQPLQRKCELFVLKQLIRKVKPNVKVPIGIVRDGKRRVIEVVWEE